MAGVIILSFRVPGEMCKDHMKHKEAKVFFTSVKAQKMNNAWLSSSIENQIVNFRNISDSPHCLSCRFTGEKWCDGKTVDGSTPYCAYTQGGVLWLSLFARHKHEYKTRM